MEVGWMDMECSIPDARTAPCGEECNRHSWRDIFRQNIEGHGTKCEHGRIVLSCKNDRLRGLEKLTVGGMMYD